MNNSKSGFIYYNVDTDRYQDIRIKRLKRNFGCSGIAIYDYVLCEIYREKGCFIEWDESTAFDVADYFAVKESLVEEVIDYCTVVGLFNKELLDSESVLTSKAIQTRFLEMSRRAKRVRYGIPKRIDLVNGSGNIPEESSKLPEDSPNLPEDSPDTEESFRNHSGGFQQSKVKKSKEEDSIIISWKDDFGVYLSELRTAYKQMICDRNFIETQERFHPNVDIKLSLEKACKNFWATEAGWQHKKKKRIKVINWKQTLTNAIDLNKVYKPKQVVEPEPERITYKPKP